MTASTPEEKSRCADERNSTFGRYFKPGYVHRDLYVSSEIFAREMDYIYAGNWVYVAHESEIPAPGDYVARAVGRRPMLVTRGRDGQIHVLANRCSHRGAIICRSERGNSLKFTCGYHCWSFGNDGRCLGVPLKHAYGESFQLSAHDLMRAPRVESYRGFIFASLNGSVPDLASHLAGAARYLDEWLDRGDRLPIAVRAGDMRFEVNANWKTVYDNAGDGYHPPFSHASMLRVFSKRYGDVDMQYYAANFDEAPLLSRDLGNGHTMLDQRPSMHASSAWMRQHVMPGREIMWRRLVERHGEDEALAMLDASTGSGLNLNIFPNLLIIGNQIQMVEPTAANRTVVHWFSTTLEGAPDEVNAIRMRMQEDFPSFGEVDDSAHFEACQQGMEQVPEMAWIDMRRHLDTGAGRRGEDGCWIEPISSDQHMRGYYGAWRTLMEAGAAGHARAEARQ